MERFRRELAIFRQIFRVTDFVSSAVFSFQRFSPQDNLFFSFLVYNRHPCNIPVALFIQAALWREIHGHDGGAVHFPVNKSIFAKSLHIEKTLGRAPRGYNFLIVCLARTSNAHANVLNPAPSHFVYWRDSPIDIASRVNSKTMRPAGLKRVGAWRAPPNRHDYHNSKCARCFPAFLT